MAMCSRIACSPVPKQREGSKRLKQGKKEKKMQLDVWRHILLGRTVKHWNRLCREMSMSQAFKHRLGKHLSGMTV